MSRLAGEFKDMVSERLGNKWQRHFEKWLFSRRAVCPTCPAGRMGTSAILGLELIRSGKVSEFEGSVFMYVCSMVCR